MDDKSMPLLPPTPISASMNPHQQGDLDLAHDYDHDHSTSMDIDDDLDVESDTDSDSIPSSPAPAYTALPHKDTQYHLAPVLDGRVGDIELETVDGKRFLVHKKVLENETVFFHIYYGFVPVWRLNGTAPTPYYHTAQQNQHTQAVNRSAAATTITASQTLNNLLCHSLPKIIASLRATTTTANANQAISLPEDEQHLLQGQPQQRQSQSEVSHHHQTRLQTRSQTQPNGCAGNIDAPPPLPPKDHLATHLGHSTVQSRRRQEHTSFAAPPPPPPSAPAPPAVVPSHPSAPTPTTSPYTWSVPETSTVLTAFLSLIYPRYTIHPSSDPTEHLTSLDMTGRVIRAALGYQSTKALTLARDRLASFIPSRPVEVYSMACFFKFGDLAKLASYHAREVSRHTWRGDSRALMGRGGMEGLVQLQKKRKDGYRLILERSLRMEEDDHCDDCESWVMMKGMWEKRVQEVMNGLEGSEEGVEGGQNPLMSLLQLELTGGGYCGECISLMGRTIQMCLMEGERLPQCV